LAPLLGLAIEQLARRVAEAPVVLKVVATVAILVVLQQLIILQYGPSQMRVEGFLPEGRFRLPGVNVDWEQLIVGVVAIVGVIGLTILSSRTQTGRGMRAVVDNPNLLSLMGTNPLVVRRRAWVIRTMFAGLSGVLVVPMIGLEPTALTMLVVQAFGA